MGCVGCGVGGGGMQAGGGLLLLIISLAANAAVASKESHNTEAEGTKLNILNFKSIIALIVEAACGVLVATAQREHIRTATERRQATHS